MHRQPNPARFFKYELFNASQADAFVQMDTYGCSFLPFVNGAMLARNLVDPAKLAFGLCPGCCGNKFGNRELQSLGFGPPATPETVSGVQEIFFVRIIDYAYYKFCVQ